MILSAIVPLLLADHAGANVLRSALFRDTRPCQSLSVEAMML